MPARARIPVPAIAGVLAASVAVAMAGCGSSSHARKHHAATTTSTTTAASAAPAKHTTSTRKHAAKPPAAKKRHAAKPTSHASGPPAAPSPPPPGLRATGGYDLYELCAGHCTGSVPAALERPLHLPALPAGGGCPVSRAKGPVKPQGSPNIHLQHFVGSSWEGAEVMWQSAASYKGPVLIRGRQIGGTGPVGFGEGHKPYDQLQLLDAAKGMPRGPIRKWPTFTRVHAPGCYGYQVDGTSFSAVIVFRAS